MVGDIVAGAIILAVIAPIWGPFVADIFWASVVVTKTHPDVEVKAGVIRDRVLGVELPNYEGLCLADLAGRFAIMNTWLQDGGRQWDLVHFGSTLQTTEIQAYMKGKQQ